MSGLLYGIVSAIKSYNRRKTMRFFSKMDIDGNKEISTQEMLLSMKTGIIDNGSLGDDGVTMLNECYDFNSNKTNLKNAVVNAMVLLDEEEFVKKTGVSINTRNIKTDDLCSMLSDAQQQINKLPKKLDGQLQK